MVCDLFTYYNSNWYPDISVPCNILIITEKIHDDEVIPGRVELTTMNV